MKNLVAHGIALSLEDYSEEQGPPEGLDELLTDKKVSYLSRSQQGWTGNDVGERMGAKARKNLGIGADCPEIGHFLADTLRVYFSEKDMSVFAVLIVQTPAGVMELNAINKAILADLKLPDVPKTLELLPVIQKDRDFVDMLKKAYKTSAFQA